jgi:hypothetical protein
MGATSEVSGFSGTGGTVFETGAEKLSSRLSREPAKGLIVPALMRRIVTAKPVAATRATRIVRVETMEARRVRKLEERASRLLAAKDGASESMPRSMLEGESSSANEAAVWGAGDDVGKNGTAGGR